MTYIPIYHRPPNKFVRYEMHRFDDGAGNTGTARVAFYLDKHGTEKQETAQVIWDRQPHTRHEPINQRHWEERNADDL